MVRSPGDTTRANVFLVVAIAVQLLIPLRYYVFGADRYDERFSWRMFSSVRMERCVARLEERHADGHVRTVPPGSVVHDAWVTHLRRSRERVIRALLARRCEAPGLRAVSLTNQCRTISGERRAPRTWTRDCRTGEERAP